MTSNKVKADAGVQEEEEDDDDDLDEMRISPLLETKEGDAR
eukprot:CAMPEP_0113652000 /NCGR_PEP_ID=MMETSP0017_2-20120614/27744_1 /TAXON_ID=2856 /ORGANISM="Cylindrotheca closterium" /LENGTH=40 /DNA_ID=CAMNT_0000564761 /DNA_START=200 /DNA_END=318 /DNA_ORIENTATION=- /assembly_acc=CAM_ASM_000147